MYLARIMCTLERDNISHYVVGCQVETSTFLVHIESLVPVSHHVFMWTRVQLMKLILSSPPAQIKDRRYDRKILRKGGGKFDDDDVVVVIVVINDDADDQYYNDGNDNNCTIYCLRSSVVNITI